MKTIKIYSEDFKRGLMFCLPWICKDESRKYMNCALLEVEAKKIKVVATDGHGLAKYEIDTSKRVLPEIIDNSDSVGSYSISTNNVKDLIKLLKSSFEQELEIEVDEEEMTVKVPGQSITFSLLKEEFPSYEVIIPSYEGKTNLEKGVYTLGLNLLEQLTKSFRPLNQKRAPQALMFEIYGQLDPCVVTTGDIPEALIVLMPMRVDDCIRIKKDNNGH